MIHGHDETTTLLFCETDLISKLFYKIAKFTAGELAQNPELQARARKIVKEHLVPRAKAGWEKSKPKREKARAIAVSTTKDIAEAARDTNPLKYPKKFLSETSKKVRDRAKHPCP